MNVEIIGENVVLKNAIHFNLEHTFECGQAFRWEKQADNSYTGVAFSKAIKISRIGDDIVLNNCSYEDFKAIWEDYFDLNRDYDRVKQTLSKDIILKYAINYGWGIRILNQETWECIISFIISASNNIPRIKKIIKLLCENFGEKIVYQNKIFYAFPTAQRLAGLEISDLDVIRAGFRAKYILDAAKKISCGCVDLAKLRQMSLFDAKKALISINGVGNKVADCVLLFGVGRCNAFPVDVWIKRIMEYLYFDGKQSIDDISLFSQEHFGELSGFAQQYLFYYARENKLGVSFNK